MLLSSRSEIYNAPERCRRLRYVRGTWVEHPTADWGKGVVLEDTEGPTVLISFEAVGIKTVSLQYVEPRVLSEPLATNDEVER